MLRSEIDTAIGEHAVWKSHLKEAIGTGKLAVPIRHIEEDDHCAFGKWFHGPTVAANLKKTAHYETVRELHADFHRVAARVATLAVTGEKAEAERLMAKGGDFSMVSSRLTAAMIKLRDRVQLASRQ